MVLMGLGTSITQIELADEVLGQCWPVWEKKLTEVNVFDPLAPRKPAQTTIKMSNSVHMVSL